VSDGSCRGGLLVVLCACICVEAGMDRMYAFATRAPMLQYHMTCALKPVSGVPGCCPDARLLLLHVVCMTRHSSASLCTPRMCTLWVMLLGGLCRSRHFCAGGVVVPCSQLCARGQVALGLLASPCMLRTSWSRGGCPPNRFALGSGDPAPRVD